MERRKFIGATAAVTTVSIAGCSETVSEELDSSGDDYRGNDGTADTSDENESDDESPAETNETDDGDTDEDADTEDDSHDEREAEEQERDEEETDDTEQESNTSDSDDESDSDETGSDETDDDSDAAESADELVNETSLSIVNSGIRNDCQVFVEVANEDGEEIAVEYLMLVYNGDDVLAKSGTEETRIDSDESRAVIAEDLDGCDEATHVQIELYDADENPPLRNVFGSTVSRFVR